MVSLGLRKGFAAGIAFGSFGWKLNLILKGRNPRNPLESEVQFEPKGPKGMCNRASEV